MMQANELRIGNFVTTKDGKIVKVENVNDYGINGEWDSEWATYPHSWINGILLTDEILEKAGFVVEFPKYEYAYKGIGEYRFLNISKDGRVVLKFMFNNSHDSFYTEHETKHIHQLQNLYFALTGEELEIKL